jgi:hypothetical protein
LVVFVVLGEVVVIVIVMFCLVRVGGLRMNKVKDRGVIDDDYDEGKEIS